MDLRGSLVDTNVRIYPTNTFFEYVKQIKEDNIPINISKLIHGSDYKPKTNEFEFIPKSVHLTNDDIELLKSIKETVSIDSEEKEDETIVSKEKETELVEDSKIQSTKAELDSEDVDSTKLKDNNDCKSNDNIETKDTSNEDKGPYLATVDVNWLYHHLHQRRTNGESVPYLHELLEGANIEMPENKVLKRNPVLEARCVKLRAQQEAREYRKMTKGVDNVRMRFPEDSISYQLKQVNRQLIAIGQFIISIFAGFLFGFKGVEWMIGSLDFGFRLLLGVMCALVIALAEIYFLAKKLNEELNIPETVQLGGPAKFVDEQLNAHMHKESKKAIDKEHQD